MVEVPSSNLGSPTKIKKSRCSNAAAFLFLVFLLALADLAIPPASEQPAPVLRRVLPVRWRYQCAQTATEYRRAPVLVH